MIPSHRPTFWCTIVYICILCHIGWGYPEVPGVRADKPVALVGGTIHPVSGPPVAATLLIVEGKIAAIGPQLELPADTQTVDIAGKQVYPGLIHAFSDIGLTEIAAVRATLDSTETGTINPNVKAQWAVNPDSELIPVTRANGVLLALTVPNGRLLQGTSAVIQLDGWTWEDMTLRAPIAMHVDWPTMQPILHWDEERSPAEQRKQGERLYEELQKAFDDAQAYRQLRDEALRQQTDWPRDARWEAMLPVIEGKLPIIAQADDCQQIQAAVGLALRYRLRLIVAGGYDALLCADLLKQHQIPVIVTSVYRLPAARHDPYDGAYTLPARLREAGIAYCIAGEGRFNAANARNLPYHAATAAAFGLPPDEALKAITLFPAQILGIADRVGSLEIGKDATLIVTSGNPLEMTTQLELAFIQGRPVDLSNRHRRLWEKYQKKRGTQP